MGCVSPELLDLDALLNRLSRSRSSPSVQLSRAFSSKRALCYLDRGLREVFNARLQIREVLEPFSSEVENPESSRRALQFVLQGCW